MCSLCVLTYFLCVAYTNFYMNENSHSHIQDFSSPHTHSTELKLKLGHTLN